MKAPRRLETARLTLAPPAPADAPAMFERYASDPDVTRYLGWPRHQSVADTRAFVAISEAEWRRWPAGPYLIRAREDGRLLGGTGLGFDRPDEAVTGYVLAKDAWGKGYATEALGAMVESVISAIDAIEIAVIRDRSRIVRHAWADLKVCATAEGRRAPAPGPRGCLLAS